MKNINKHESILKQIGAKIQMQRKKLGFSQKELAEKVGVSRVYIGYIEQGRESPSLRTIIKLSEALKIRLDKLFADIGKPERE